MLFNDDGTWLDKEENKEEKIGQRMTIAEIGAKVMRKTLPKTERKMYARNGRLLLRSNQLIMQIYLYTDI